MLGIRQFRVSATVAALFLSLGVFAGPFPNVSSHRIPTL
jgi:hypothetical protein